MIIYYHCTKDTSTVIYTRFIQINHHDTNSGIKSTLSEGVDLKVKCHRMSYFLSCTSQEQVSQEMYHNLYGRFIGMVVQMTQ